MLSGVWYFMSILSVLVICGILMIASLLVVSFVNRQHTRKRVVTHKIWELRRRINELEEVGAAIEPLVESPIIPKAINDEIIDLINTVTSSTLHCVFGEQFAHSPSAVGRLYGANRSVGTLPRAAE